MGRKEAYKDDDDDDKRCLASTTIARGEPINVVILIS